MKTISNIIASAALLLAPMLHAQNSPPQVGFIRIVNAVGPGEGNTTIQVDGAELYPKGYKLGQRTGGIGLNTGSHKITVKKDGVMSGETKVDIGLGQTTTLVVFAERVESEDPEEPVKWQAKILRLKQSDPERGYRLTVVSVCSEKEVDFHVATESKRTVELKTVKRFNVASADLGNSRGNVEIRVKGADKSLCVLSLDEAGNYVAVLYNDADGKIQALTFYDPKFVIAG